MTTEKRRSEKATQAALLGAMKAVSDAGLPIAGVEVTADGTVRVLVGAQQHVQRLLSADEQAAAEQRRQDTLDRIRKQTEETIADRKARGLKPNGRRT